MDAPIMDINVGKEDIVGDSPGIVEFSRAYHVRSDDLNISHREAQQALTNVANGIGGDSYYTNTTQAIVLGDPRYLVSGVVPASGTDLTSYTMEATYDIGNMSLGASSGYFNHSSTDNYNDLMDPGEVISHTDAVAFIEGRDFQISGVQAGLIDNSPVMTPFGLIKSLDLIMPEPSGARLGMPPISGVIGMEYSYAASGLPPSGTIATRLYNLERNLGSPGDKATSDPGDLVYYRLAYNFIQAIKGGGEEDTWNASFDCTDKVPGWYKYTVRKSTNYIDVEMWGAGGGAGGFAAFYSDGDHAEHCTGATGGSGGSGGYIRFKMKVTPGQELFFYIPNGCSTGNSALYDGDDEFEGGANWVRTRTADPGPNGVATQLWINSQTGINLANAWSGSGGLGGSARMNGGPYPPITRFTSSIGGAGGTGAVISTYNTAYETSGILSDIVVEAGAAGAHGYPLTETIASIGIRPYALGAWCPFQSTIMNVAAVNMGRGNTSQLISVLPNGSTDVTWSAATNSYSGRVVVREQGYEWSSDPRWSGW